MQFCWPPSFLDLYGIIFWCHKKHCPEPFFSFCPWISSWIKHFFKMTFIYLCTCMWRSEGNLPDSDLSFRHVGSRNRTWGIRHGQCPHRWAMSHAHYRVLKMESLCVLFCPPSVFSEQSLVTHVPVTLSSDLGAELQIWTGCSPRTIMWLAVPPCRV